MRWARMRALLMCLLLWVLEGFPRVARIADAGHGLGVSFPTWLLVHDDFCSDVGTCSLTPGGNRQSVGTQVWDALHLRGSLKSLNNSGISRVIDAFTLAIEAQKNSAVDSRVFIHKLTNVAALLADLQASESVILASALRHVDLHPPSMSARFGSDAIALATNCILLPEFEPADRYSLLQAESCLQMLVVLAGDYRTLFMRLVDVLHQLRTLPSSFPRRRALAQEALHVYAPLAHRMGATRLTGELEDLAFCVLEPQLFQLTRTSQGLAERCYREAGQHVRAVLASDDTLRRLNATVKLSHRVKHRYQVALKMRRKQLTSPLQVHDILGLRVVVDLPASKTPNAPSHDTRGAAVCYHVIRLLGQLPGWDIVTESFKDYIAQTKDNSYSSLHQSIRRRSTGTRVEIQVRTKAMHRVAELGEAAHWHYKDLQYRPELAHSRMYRLAWRSPEQLAATSPAEVVALARVQLRAAKVFVFAQDRATALCLRRGATALDAAFAVHTELGLRASAISVNGQPGPLDRPLANGDVVSVRAEEVYTADVGWLSLVASPHSMGVLRRFLRDHRHSDVLVLGLRQLLLHMQLNEAAIVQRLDHKALNARSLSALARARCGMTLREVVERLGLHHDPAAVVHLLCQLLNLSPSEVTTVSASRAETLQRELCLSPHLRDLRAHLVAFLEEATD